MSNGEQFLRVGNKYVRVASIAFIELLPSGRIQIVLCGPHSDEQKVDVDPHEAEHVKRFLERFSANGAPVGKS
jgi:hypothetical protein